MKCSARKDQTAEIIEWIRGREQVKGPPQLGWDDLTPTQKRYLAAWYVLTLTYPPRRRERMPVEAVKALSELSFVANQGRSRRFTRQRISTGEPGGNRRKVRARTAYGVKLRE